jgi:soluble lytic murein transglycosylase
MVAAFVTATPAFAAPTTQRSAPVVLGERLGRAIAILNTDPDKAAKSLAEIKSDSDLLDDLALYFLALAQTPVNATLAVSTLDSLLSEYPTSIVTPQAAALLSELLLGKGEATRLADLADKYADSERRSEHAARMSLAAARGLADDDPKHAAVYFQRTRRQGAGSRYATSARLALAELRKKHPELEPTSATAIYDEAVLAGIDGAGDEQARLLDLFLAKYPSHAKATEATIMRAKVMVKAKGRLGAADWLRERAKKASNRRTKARLLYFSAWHAWNGNDSKVAQRDFEAMLALKTGISTEQKAHYALGRIHESARRFNAAASAYRKAGRGADQSVAMEGNFRGGWASYLAGNYAGAAWVFGNIADAGKNASRGKASGREEALYWQARSFEKGGRSEKASASYRTLLSEFPDGFYAYLAEKRTGLTADPPKVVKLESSDDEVPVAAARVLARARAMRAANLEQFAAEEISTGLADTDASILRRILPQVLELGAFNTALKTSLRLYRRGLLDEEQLYPYLYPPAFEPIVRKEATARGLDPYLVMSLMRQESLLDTFAVSPAAAYGLMQLLLSTANRMAEDSGIGDVDALDLFKPSTNIQLGVRYLSDLAKRFNNDPVLMLAGYNAGENAADRWKERLEGLEQDEFIEQISYRETRSYVKKILRNYRNYLRLYGELRSSTTAKLGEQAPW